MTVSELMNKLDRLDPEATIVVKPPNSNYASHIRGIRGAEIHSMWGPDFEAFVITCGEQTGSVEW